MNKFNPPMRSAAAVINNVAAAANANYEQAINALKADKDALKAEVENKDAQIAALKSEVENLQGLLAQSENVSKETEKNFSDKEIIESVFSESRETPVPASAIEFFEGVVDSSKEEYEKGESAAHASEGVPKNRRHKRKAENEK